MATYIISSQKDAYDAFYKNLVTNLLTFVSKKAIAVVREKLRAKGSISTKTMQKFVTYKLDIKAGVSSIYIDFDAIEKASPKLEENLDEDNDDDEIEWGWFRNTFSGYGGKVGDIKWNGKTIAWNMAKWLENGGPTNGNLTGNQPIQKIAWYTEAKKEIGKQVSKWLKEFFGKK